MSSALSTEFVWHVVLTKTSQAYYIVFYSEYRVFQTMVQKT